MPPNELAELTTPASEQQAEDAQLERVAATARFFLTCTNGEVDWIYRRVERISIDDNDTARRTITVDFRCPAAAEKAALPLALREKEFPNGVRVTGLEGELPILTARESALVLYTSLMSAARLGEIEPDERQESLLLRVIFEQIPEALAAVEELCEEEPAWDEKRLRSLLELVAIYRPVFAVLDPGAGRQQIELNYPSQELIRPSERSMFGRLGRLIRGRVSIFTTLTAWPSGASTYLQVLAPSLAEISSANLYGGPSTPRQTGPHGSFVQLDLDSPGANRIGLRFVVSLRPVLSASLLTVSLVLFALLLAARFNAVTGLAFGATTLALLCVPGVFLARVTVATGLRTRGLYASLLRGPTVLIGISVLLGIVAIVSGDSGTSTLLIGLALAAALLPVPYLVRSLLEDADAEQGSLQHSVPKPGAEMRRPLVRR